jgi:CheY-like chemotaxis protein
MPDDPRPALLLVDDHPANLIALEALLAPIGADFVRAGTGRAALEAAEQRPFAAVLLDDFLPDMRGGDVARALRQALGERCPPILMHTASDSSAEERRAWLEEGVVAIVPKPCDPEVLLDLVGDLVRAAGRRPGPTAAGPGATRR